jgi:hypothetical protein
MTTSIDDHFNRIGTTALNKITKVISFPLPLIDDLLALVVHEYGCKVGLLSNQG